MKTRATDRHQGRDYAKDGPFSGVVRHHAVMRGLKARMGQGSQETEGTVSQEKPRLNEEKEEK